MAQELFSQLERQHGLPSGLLDAVWAKESARGKQMRSPVGAMGHFQFMPATAKEYGLTNPDDLTQSAGAAAKMYGNLLKQYGGDLPKALAAYNWGSGNLERKGLDRAPAETRDYIATISSKVQPKGPTMAGRDFSAELFGDAPKAPTAGRDFSAELFADEPPKRNPVLQQGANLLGGAVRGAGSLGATVMRALPNFLGGDTAEENEQRRRDMDAALQNLIGADPDSLAYQGGKLGAEIAGTAPIGGLLGRGVGAAANMAGRGAQAAPLVQALTTSGFNAGGATGGAGLALRALGGGATGAATAAAVNPEDAGSGAMIGGALPVIGRGVAAGSQALGSLFKADEKLKPLARAAVDKYGIPLSVSDVTGSKATKAVRNVLDDTWVVGRSGVAQNEAKQQAFNKAVGGTFGAGAKTLTPEVMDAAKKSMGAEFDRLWGGNSLKVDPDMVRTLQALQENADKLPQGEGRRIMAEIDDLFSKMVPDQNGELFIPGDVANRFQSSLGKKVSTAQGFLQEDLSTLRKTIIGAFNRGISPEDAAALTANRSKYKAFKTIEPLMNSAETGVAGRTGGDVPAALLPNAVRSSYSNPAGLPLTELSQIGSQFLVNRVPNTGGGIRAAVQNSAIGGALVGGSFASIPAALSSVPLAIGLEKALSSPALGAMALKDPAASALWRQLMNPEVQGAIARTAPVLIAQ
jgi:hypothetical protein